MGLLSVSSVMSTIGSVLLAILILLVMITVHEFGHYLAGKALKFKISEFAIGFGPKIFKRKSKKTGELFSIRALNCGKEGGTLPCALNAADEVAVKAFLDGKIKFTDICATVEHVMSSTVRDELVSYKQLEEVDRNARWKAQKFIYKLSK